MSPLDAAPAQCSHLVQAETHAPSVTSYSASPHSRALDHTRRSESAPYVLGNNELLKTWLMCATDVCYLRDLILFKATILLILVFHSDLLRWLSDLNRVLASETKERGRHFGLSFTTCLPVIELKLSQINLDDVFTVGTVDQNASTIGYRRCLLLKY